MVVPEREPLTMAEARRIGDSAQKLTRYRYLLTKADCGGSMNVTPGKGELYGVNLSALDATAALALLIEREEQFLSSMGVDVREPTL